MNRFASAAAIVMSLVLSTSAFAQSKAAAAPNKPATPPPTTPTAKAKWVVPVKGTVYVEVIKGAPKRVKDDIVTTLQIKNVSTGAIALLKVDEYWYSKTGQTVTGDTQKVKQPIMPGEVVEVTLKSPYRKDMYQNQFAFSHQGGKVDPKAVKSFKK
ncbi:MAG: hypothetical protein DMF85_00535 [Acidobacteria bacterium]|nr:MAG: hypothetical protein DMF85_00535 [Acidobacteriota bacterium]